MTYKGLYVKKPNQTKPNQTILVYKSNFWYLWGNHEIYFGSQEFFQIYFKYILNLTYRIFTNKYETDCA